MNKLTKRTLAALALAGAALSLPATAHADGPGSSGLVSGGEASDVTADGVGHDVNKGVGKLLFDRPLAAVEGVNTGHVI
ncbi:hypothetical protein ACIRTB_32455 [Streptomyces sp. NPDC101158]|uniref:hypothetical protein n=1 Tax=Streptomyces sp. NPDC101158 TaxID=3366117 RepID=UPI00380D051E